VDRQEPQVIVYYDTSNLIKLYVHHEDSAAIDGAGVMADRAASAQFTYVEMRAALASARRDKRLARNGVTLDGTAYAAVIAAFDKDWSNFIRVRLSNRMIEAAGVLAEKHALTGADAVQLTSAMELVKQTYDEVRFSVADQRLRAAAINEGFEVL
jgi:predicted nucleic acid-binding protein